MIEELYADAEEFQQFPKPFGVRIKSFTVKWGLDRPPILTVQRVTENGITQSAAFLAYRTSHHPGQVTYETYIRLASLS